MDKFSLESEIATSVSMHLCILDIIQALEQYITADYKISQRVDLQSIIIMSKSTSVKLINSTSPTI